MEASDIIMIGLGILAILVLLVFLYSYAFPSNDIFYDVSATGKATARNDSLNADISVSSKLSQSPKAAYSDIQQTVSKIKKLLESEPKVHNLKINSTVREEYDFTDKGRELQGHKAVASISYQMKIKSNACAKHASKIQNMIMSYSTDQAKISIDRVNYHMSDDYRDGMQNAALENAIKKAKEMAQILVTNAHPGRSYEIVKISTSRYDYSYNRSAGLRLESKSAQDTSFDMVAEGDSEVTANISLKIKVV